MALADLPRVDPLPRGADPRLRSGAGRPLPLGILIFAGGIAAALFSSRVLLQEIETQPDMIGYVTVKRTGAMWDKAMHAIGTTVPDRVLHDAIRRVETQAF
jgi:hypothetical protein